MRLSEMFSHWEQVRGDLLTAIDRFEEGELRHAPFDGSWPAGKIMLHIAECEDSWLHGVVRRELTPWLVYELSQYPTKEAIRTVLDAAHQRTRGYLESADTSDLDSSFSTPNGEQFTLRWIVWHVLEHEIHHRGELSLILGQLGREGLDI